jgi:hypothetical protein
MDLKLANRQGFMAELLLLTDGDDIEKNAWEPLRPFSLFYERFWRTHVYPLRCHDSIHFRNGIDEQFETLAMNHYTTFANLARAHQKISTKSEDFKFSEEIYANLQRAAEVAMKTVDAFRKLYRECLQTSPKVSTEGLAIIEESFRIYRNILHDPVLATVKDEDGVRLIPRRDKMDKYRRWTAAMYDRNLKDFVPVEKQLKDDFAKLSSSLQSAWKEMEGASKLLVKSPRYIKRRDAGESPPQPSTAVPIAVSGSIIELDKK